MVIINIQLVLTSSKNIVMSKLPNPPTYVRNVTKHVSTEFVFLHPFQTMNIYQFNGPFGLQQYLYMNVVGLIYM